MDDTLLPSNATAFERAASLAINTLPRVAPGIAAMRTAKLVSIPDSFLPFLVYEYGLGPASAYVPDQRALIGTGIDWQRVRGTPDAVARALDWIGYEGVIEEARTNRRRWNLFQIGLDRLRDQEEPDLEQIEGVIGLSVPVRSHFFRGFHGYDVREAEWSRRRYGGGIWSSTSGVRLRPGAAKWSFGRAHDFSVALTENDLLPLGAWVEYDDVGSYGWGTPAINLFAEESRLTWAGFPWNATEASWNYTSEAARLHGIAAALSNRPVWVAFRDVDGDVIGYRRARVARSVNAFGLGEYQVGGFRMTAAVPGTSFYVEAMTAFGDGFGSAVASVALVFDATVASPAKPGLQWVGPGGLTGGVQIALRPVSFQFGRTVRERVRYHLTF